MTHEDQGTAFDSGAVGHEKVGRKKPLLCLDFDGVIHGYQSGWQGASVIPDPPVPGAIEFIIAALEHFRVAIYSSRSESVEGIEAMQSYLVQAVEDWIQPKTIYDHRRAVEFVVQIEWPTSKPPAFLTIDDRAVTFLGWWPAPETLLAFKTWQQDGFIPLTKAPVIHPRTPAERQPFAWARDHGEGSCDFLTNQGPDRPDGEGWFPLYRDPA